MNVEFRILNFDFEQNATSARQVLGSQIKIQNSKFTIGRCCWGFSPDLWVV